MKKSILTIVLLLALTPRLAAQQQLEDKRSESPFAFAEFRDAKVLQPFGRFVRAKANILLRHSTLCYKEGDKVKQAYVKNILGVEFDSVKYVKVDSAMARVIATKNYNQLVCVTTIDMRRYEAETYGGDRLPYFFLEEMGSVIEIDSDKHGDAKGFPLKDKYYFIIKGRPYAANERVIKKQIRPDMKLAFKNLMADRFWSWSDPESLKQLLEYLPK